MEKRASNQWEVQQDNGDVKISYLRDKLAKVSAWRMETTYCGKGLTPEKFISTYHELEGKKQWETGIIILNFFPFPTLTRKSDRQGRLIHRAVASKKSLSRGLLTTVAPSLHLVD